MNRPLIVFALMALLCADSTAQRGGRAGRFRRPDQAAFEKAPVVLWQRNLDDALQRQRETGKPLLLCVNMDGEIACDQLAAFRYRDPAFARLATGFLPLIASPNRHTPKDHDAQGRRIPCPRFGSVLCSEHIDIEPELFARYFKGERSAPRHLAVSAAGEELFDLFLLNRLADIDDALKAHGKPVETPNDAKAKSLSELLGSADAEDRRRLEERFATATEPVQAGLLSSLEGLPTENFEILRLALHSESTPIRRAAIDRLARTESPAALALFEPACDQAETLGGLKPLVLALQRMAPAHAEADRLARTRRGLYADSNIVDLEAWLHAIAEGGESANEPDQITDLEELDRLMDALAKDAQQHPNDGEIQLRLAAANLRYGQIQLAAGNDPTFLFQDALHAARLAERMGAAKGPTKGYSAWLHYLLGDFEAASRAASEALPALLASADSKLSAEVLSVFATCRTRALYAAVTRGSKWPAEWIADIHSAQRVLARHRFAKQNQAAAHLDLLVFLNARHQEREALRVAMHRFPDSPDIQECLRRNLLRDRGPEGLIQGYREIAPQEGKQASQAWFAGYANLVAAERLVENKQGDRAIPAYGDAIELFQECADRSPDYSDSANHFIALALAGRARLEMTSKSLQAAVDDLCAALERRPPSARSTDGLGNTPLGTAWLLRSALTDAKDETLSQKLSEKLDQLGFDLGAEDSR